MATSLYDVCVKSYLQILGGLATVLDKGATHAAENDIDLDNLINARLRDELLNRELFLSVTEAQWGIDRWRTDFSHHRSHSALKYQTPAASVANRQR